MITKSGIAWYEYESSLSCLIATVELFQISYFLLILNWFIQRNFSKSSKDFIYGFDDAIPSFCNASIVHQYLNACFPKICPKKKTNAHKTLTLKIERNSNHQHICRWHVWKMKLYRKRQCTIQCQNIENVLFMWHNSVCVYICCCFNRSDSNQSIEKHQTQH